MGYKAEGIIVLKIEVLNTLSDFALKMKDLFKSIGRLRRSGKGQIDSKTEGIIVLGGLRST